MKNFLSTSFVLLLLLTGCAQQPADRTASIQTEQSPQIELTQEPEISQESQEIDDSHKLGKIENLETIQLNEEFVTIQPDTKGITCSNWAKICFSVPSKYFVYDFENDETLEYSYLTITTNTEADFADGDANFSYAGISFLDDHIKTISDLRAETDSGNYYEFSVVEPGENIKIGNNTFYKLVVKGYGSPTYDFYFIEKNGHLYQFKSGSENDEKQVMVNLLKSLEFKSAM